MSFSIEFADENAGYDARIKVIGCGGSGGNAVNTMINFGLGSSSRSRHRFAGLHANAAPLKLHIGANVTAGLSRCRSEKAERPLEDITRLKEVTRAPAGLVTGNNGRRHRHRRGPSLLSSPVKKGASPSVSSPNRSSSGKTARAGRAAWPSCQARRHADYDPEPEAAHPR
jgi:hypothetical protein